MLARFNPSSVFTRGLVHLLITGMLMPAVASASMPTVPLDRETMALVQQLDAERRETVLRYWGQMTPSERTRLKSDLESWSNSQSAVRSGVSGFAAGGLLGSVGILARAALTRTPPTPMGLAVVGGAAAVGTVVGLVNHYGNSRKKADQAFTRTLARTGERIAGRGDNTDFRDMDLATSRLLDSLSADERERILTAYSKGDEAAREQLRNAVRTHSENSGLYGRMKSGALGGTALGLAGAVAWMLPKAMASAPVTSGVLMTVGGMAAGGLALGLGAGYLWNRFISKPRADRALGEAITAVEQANANRPVAPAEPAAPAPVATPREVAPAENVAPTPVAPAAPAQPADLNADDVNRTESGM